MKTLINRLGMAAMVLGISLVISNCSHTTPLVKTKVTENLVTQKEDAATKARVQEAYGKLPLYFIENRGQLDRRVAYYVQGRDTTVYFTAEGVTFALTDQAAPDPPVHTASLRPTAFDPEADQEGARQRWLVKLDFVGANPDVKPIAKGPTPAVISYFKGSASQWKTGLPTYASLVYADLWPGIDLVYTGTFNRLKYTFVVKPGADPSQINLAYRGATAVRANRAGQLEVSTPVGDFHDDKPYAYQEVEGLRAEVATAYYLDAATAEDMHIYGFRVGAYDLSKPLIIDPVVLIYAGYIGGLGSDQGSQGIAVDSAGNAYVTGRTASTEATFPVSVGPDLTFNGGEDAFVAKVKADGSGLEYAGYIGGSGGDIGLGIAVDSAGNAYITGITDSSEATFPVTVGPDLTFNGGSDAFVAKVKADGSGLEYAGYIGGSGEDIGLGIAVDSAGNAYVTGRTPSSEATFPVSVGPDLTFNGIYDAFVAKVKADGSGLEYAGYIGGSDFDQGLGIAVDSAGNAYVTGDTSSTEATFPVTVGPDLTLSGGGDAFVAKVKADGSGLEYAGYIGGSGGEEGLGIAVDSTGNAYVVGTTNSTEATFPVTVGPDLTFNGGINDTFVAKVKVDGSGLEYAGYIGGSDIDGGSGIAVDSAGNAYVTGVTNSTEATFPVTVGPDLTFNGFVDAFVAKVKADGSGLEYAGYIGGSDFDGGSGIAVDPAGNAYVNGQTISTEATFPVTVGPDLTFNGGVDAFVAKIGSPFNTPSGSNVVVSPGSGTTVTFSTVSSPGNTTVTTSSTGPPIPAGFQLLGTYYEISTTATFTPPVTVCIQYGPPGDPGAQLFHFESGAWVNVTTSNDTITGIICGQVSSLSPFFVGHPISKPTLIRLSSFSVTPGMGKVVIAWTTGAEIDNEGFNIIRSGSPNGPFVKINPLMIPARGISPGGASYSFVDSNVENGKTYSYQLEDIDTRGVKTAHNIASATPMLVGVPPSETDKSKTATASSLLQASGGTKTVSSTRSQAFFFQMPEESGNTLEVARLETQTQKEAVDKEDTTSTMPTFKAISGDGQIALEWTADSPSDSFNILRSEIEEGEYVEINGSVISPLNEDSEAIRNTYADTHVVNGTTFYYKLERVSPEGKSTFIGPIPATPQLALSHAQPEQKQGEGGDTVQ